MVLQQSYIIMIQNLTFSENDAILCLLKGQSLFLQKMQNEFHLYLKCSYVIQLFFSLFQVLREVKALANLQHTNIVGYNACWLEYGGQEANKNNSSKFLFLLQTEHNHHFYRNER